MFNKRRGLLGLIVPAAVVVILAGTVAVAGASSAGRTGMRHRYSTRGVVTSVDGIPTAGRCGTSGATGLFTLVGPGRRAITNVDVTSDTTFTAPTVGSSAAPSYADVCVGTRVEALGTFATGTLTATSVAVLTPSHLSGGHRTLRGNPLG
jgi:hypothetical protein